MVSPFKGRLLRDLQPQPSNRKATMATTSIPGSQHQSLSQNEIGLSKLGPGYLECKTRDEFTKMSLGAIWGLAPQSPSFWGFPWHRKKRYLYLPTMDLQMNGRFFFGIPIIYIWLFGILIHRTHVYSIYLHLPTFTYIYHKDHLNVGKLHHFSMSHGHLMDLMGQLICVKQIGGSDGFCVLICSRHTRGTRGNSLPIFAWSIFKWYLFVSHRNMMISTMVSMSWALFLVCGGEEANPEEFLGNKPPKWEVTQYISPKILESSIPVYPPRS